MHPLFFAAVLQRSLIQSPLHIGRDTIISVAATDSMFTWSLHDLCEQPSPLVVIDQL